MRTLRRAFSAIVLAGALLVTPVATGCRPAKDGSSQVEASAQAAYTAGTVALTASVEVVAAYADSLAEPTPDQVAALDKALEGLRAAESALKLANAALVDGRDADVRQCLAEAQRLLSAVLAATGAKPSPELATALQTLQLFLGGAQ